MRNNPEVLQALNTYQLGLPNVPIAGRSGELLGRGTGSSLEFQEYREYAAGDDIRHLDWAAYARSDTLMVRLFREEISPRMEVLLDGSRSMTTQDGVKFRVASQLTSLLALLSGKLGSQPRLFLLGDERPIFPMGMELLDRLPTHECSAVATLPELIADNAVPLKGQSVRVIISDFLFPHDPGWLVRRLASNSSILWLVQVLSRFEADPSQMGGRRLIDVESEQQLDLILNKQTIADYLRRLNHLQQELALHCRRMHASFITVVADDGFPKICREELTQAGLLRAS